MDTMVTGSNFEIQLSKQPLRDCVFDVYEGANRHQYLKDHRSHFPYPLHWRVVLVDISLNKRVGDNGLCRTDVRPAAAERISGNLSHRKQVKRVDIEIVQPAGSKVRDNVIVQDRGEERGAEELGYRDVGMPEYFDASADQFLHLIEKSCLRQQGYRQEQRKQEVVFRIFVPSFAESEAPHFCDVGNADDCSEESGKGGEKQRHVVVYSMKDQQRNEWQKGNSPDLLGALPYSSQSRQRRIHASFGFERAGMITRRIQYIVTVQ